MVRVTRASGKRQRFNPRKIYRTCLRAGVSRKTAKEVTEEIEESIYDGIETKEILKMVIQGLRKRGKNDAASRYDLKQAIMRMGPEGFPFETFLAQVLERYGYRTKLRQYVQGFCVRQEIDIIIVKDGKREMVEVKYHNSPGIYTGLKEAMYTHARFLDLQEGYEAGKCEEFQNAWLATNTRSSDEARKYTSCNGLKLLGWRQPEEGGIERMVEEKGLYPVTLLPSLNKNTFRALSKANIMLMDNLASHDSSELSQLTGMKIEDTRSLLKRAHSIIDDPLGRYD